MVFDSVSEEQRKRFFKQSYAAHLPGYTGHCPTLRFRVGKRFGACTQEIMKELLEKKILKTGPYRPNSERNMREHMSVLEKNTNTDWTSEPHFFKAPPYILGYTGYIPGFNNRYGLSFMRAVEEGAREWRENQTKLKARRDLTQTKIEKSVASKNHLLQTRTDNIGVHIHHNHHYDHDYEVSPERPPIVGYTGHIPGVKGEVALSKRYAQAAKRGLELVRKEREQRLGKLTGSDTVQGISNVDRYDKTEFAEA
ncbi:PREDICTED: uncharacterized protein LOC108548500 isoform X2 [Eufriesea mexicana]|uniref:uncharacterized protein LOC108548500 isoform X2 n=1 Tax=Eufriesea mexicana TaxID=516756 RepID=UPI00083C8421|nr:PREDICTED: uncharacterized protein LOC108548500 isoform X2 [Eufriesea mexicana]